MAARIRLRRTGTTKRPAYRVVVADSRTARDGRFVEQIGFYDPLTEPPTIRIDADRAAAWLRKGALPSGTVRNLLARAGVRAG
jgi:small subunit ribosomal protein S16